jgi:protein transport protein SEC61 subunit gamma and related proteins
LTEEFLEIKSFIKAPYFLFFMEYNPVDRTLSGKLRNFVAESIRVLKITKKPTKEEYQTILKASALGMAIIGILGFLIQIIMQLIK